MSFTTEITGFNTVFKYSTSGPYSTPFTGTTITKTIEVEPPQYSVTKVKTTNLTLTDKAHTYQPGLLDPNTAKATIVFDKTLVNTIETTLMLVMAAWEVTYEDGSTLGFNGYVAKKGTKTPMEDMVIYEFEIQCSGKPIFTPAA